MSKTEVVLAGFLFTLGRFHYSHRGITTPVALASFISIGVLPWTPINGMVWLTL
jgi:hypothetical protein